jgi:aspartyl-tRNA(Asn)/glutamyl-tRNA(Gln) amidotransferase subunit A
VLSRPDARDSMSLPWQVIAWDSFDQGTERLRGLKIGLLLDAGCGLPAEPEVLAAQCKRPHDGSRPLQAPSSSP